MGTPAMMDVRMVSSLSGPNLSTSACSGLPSSHHHLSHTFIHTCVLVECAVLVEVGFSWPVVYWLLVASVVCWRLWSSASVVYSRQLSRCASTASPGSLASVPVSRVSRSRPVSVYLPYLLCVCLVRIFCLPLLLWSLCLKDLHEKVCLLVAMDR